MASRTTSVLERFPNSLELTDEGKRFATVVDALAANLDVVTRQTGDVRVAHRIGEAPSRVDVLRLAALHEIGRESLELVADRILALRTAATNAALGVTALSARLAELVNVSAATLESVAEALVAGTSGTNARQHLAAMGFEPATHRRRLVSDRAVVTALIGAYRIGNATPTALLKAAGAYLGLNVGEVAHVSDRWWHVARCRDGIGLVAPPRPTPREGEPPLPVLPDLAPSVEVLALEENPYRRADLAPTPRQHGQRFRILRGGLENVSVSVRVVGLGNRTVRPMVVHLDAGRGVVFEGDVPGGVELVFTAAGRVTLGTADVTGSSWAFAGAVFAAADATLPGVDFAFADSGSLTAGTGRRATFAVTTPIGDAFESTSSLPHGAASVDPLTLPIGESRWAAFVRLAHAGAGPSTAAVPRNDAGRFDASVFADTATSGSLSIVEPSLAVGFTWDEREPFAIRLLLPHRFSTLDSDEGRNCRETLRLLLDRHRAAGVALRIEYADPRWTLGSGVLRSGDADPLGVVFAGTELWADPGQPPSPATPIGSIDPETRR